MTYIIDANTGEVVKASKINEDIVCTYLTATVSGSGDNTIIAAPDNGKRLVIYSFILQNESETANTMILGDSFRILAPGQGDGLAIIFDANIPFRLTEADALVLNLSAATPCGYSIQYAIEEV